MKMVAISKDGDTSVGFRLSGIESYCIKEEEEIIQKFNEISKDNSIGIIILTCDILKLLEKEVKHIMNTQKIPLVVTVPDNLK